MAVGEVVDGWGPRGGPAIRPHSCDSYRTLKTAQDTRPYPLLIFHFRPRALLSTSIVSRSTAND